MKTKPAQKKVHMRSKRQSRPLHKKLFLHPLTILLLLCAGVLLAGATFQSHAADLEVSATVPAPIPTSPAIITSPSDQQHFTDSLITVSGTCPADSYVELYNNSQFSGVSQCVGGAFSIQTSLVVGANVLQAKVYNITDNEGAVSAPITVHYDPPSPVSPPASLPENTVTPNNPDTSPPNVSLPLLPAPPLTGTTDYHYQALYPGQQWSWNIGLAGGRGPYTITIDWGDGTTTTIGPDDKTTYTLTHIYKSPGTYHPIITITDQSGQIITLQLLAIVKPPTSSLFAAPAFPLGDVQSYLGVIWPAYAVIVLMTASFWLGEYEVFQRLAHRSTHGSHRMMRK
ncbi:MAG TPA: hypothetical protein VK502_02105 [Candidatus Saccharimonadales bacterium]|nr:hypothetical protein [Candidatus Saccharimonadales bacterium]